jgi:hypothetical protein
VTGTDLRALAERTGKSVVAFYPDTLTLQIWCDDWREPDRWDLERTYRFLYPAFSPIRDNRGISLYVSPI